MVRSGYSLVKDVCLTVSAVSSFVELTLQEADECQPPGRTGGREDGDDPPSTEYHLNETPPPPAHPPLVASSGSASSSIGDTFFYVFGGCFSGPFTSLPKTKSYGETPPKLYLIPGHLVASLQPQEGVRSQSGREDGGYRADNCGESRPSDLVDRQGPEGHSGRSPV